MTGRYATRIKLVKADWKMLILINMLAPMQMHHCEAFVESMYQCHQGNVS
jgi:hypothetical protein